MKKYHWLPYKQLILVWVQIDIEKISLITLQATYKSTWDQVFPLQITCICIWVQSDIENFRCLITRSYIYITSYIFLIHENFGLHHWIIIQSLDKSQHWHLRRLLSMSTIHIHATNISEPYLRRLVMPSLLDVETT